MILLNFVVILANHISATLGYNPFAAVTAVCKLIILHRHTVGQLHVYGGAVDIFKAVVLDADIFVKGGNILMLFAVYANKNGASAVVSPFSAIAKQIVSHRSVGQRTHLKPILKGSGQIKRPRGRVIKGAILNKQVVGALQGEVALPPAI